MKTEKGSTAAYPQGDLTGRPDLTGAATLTLPTNGGYGVTAISPNSILRATKWVFRGSDNNPVLTITAEGELIFADASEAAEALLREWMRLTGRDCPCTPAEGRFLSTCRTHGETGARSAES